MIALDLFAGTGWGVACQALGIDEHGVEIMPEAQATRARNGMRTIYGDVWEGLTNDLIESRAGYGREAAEAMRARGVSFAEIYELLIASPPCQTFSMAGGGAGRKALDDVLGLIDAKAYRSVEDLRAFGETHDPRTALVLTPLAHVYRDVPTFVVFEQVPPVLPVWERCAEEMRAWGYSVWVGILSAEQYGVPQTRKRAILIARADGIEAAPPTPTHSRYYSTDPSRLDPDVEPWVSMAEALGWGMTERPFITAGNAVGRAEGVGGSGGKRAVEREKAKGAWIGNQYPDKKIRERQRRDADLPVPTISSGSKSALIERDVEHPAPTITAGQRSARWKGVERGDVEAVRLGMGKGMIERHGPRPGRDAADPAFTVVGGEGGSSQPGFGWQAREGFRGAWGMTDRPYPTVASGTERGGGTDPLAVGGSGARKIITDARDRGAWVDERPAKTVAGDSRVWAPGHKVNADDIARLGDAEAREKYGDRAGTTAERVTVAEAAALQSYPDDFVWDVEMSDPKTGKLKPITKTKTFLQIGNAVPPLLAYRILEGFLS